MKSATTILVLCVSALLALGMVILYSSGMADKEGTRSFLMQLVWCVLGLGACVAAALMDYRILRKFTWLLFAAGVFLLLLVLIPQIGVKLNGARRWLPLPGGIRFQPSELAKIVLIIALAWYGERYQRRMGDWKKGILLPCLFAGPLLGLIFIEPDRGATILLGAVAGAILLIAGVRWRHLIPPAVVGAALLCFSILNDPVRSDRVRAWINPAEHKMAAGLQADHAMLALGSGGWMGVGLGNSRQKLGFLPFHNTDFILPIVGEELGVIATLSVVLAFLAIVLCGFYISIRSCDTFGLLLGSGITLLIGLQAIINIGVVTGLLPNKGLPLPFISYGGSNLFMTLTSIGLLLSIARRAGGASIGGALFQREELSPK